MIEFQAPEQDPEIYLVIEIELEIYLVIGQSLTLEIYLEIDKEIEITESLALEEKGVVEWVEATPIEEEAPVPDIDLTEKETWVIQTGKVWTPAMDTGEGPAQRPLVRGGLL